MDMSKKPNYYNKVLQILQELHTMFPQYNMGKHLATVVDECGNIWGVTDKELAYCLAKYKGQLEMDVKLGDDFDIDNIIKEGLDLDNLFKEEEDGDY
jgi:hypothetical protein